MGTAVDGEDDVRVSLATLLSSAFTMRTAGELLTTAVRPAAPGTQTKS